MQSKSIIRKHRPDLLILLFMALLMLFGLIMIYQVSPQVANASNNLRGTSFSPNHFFIGQLRSVVVSLVAFIVAFKVPHAFLRKHARSIFIFGIAVSAVLFIASLFTPPLPIAQCALGACRWMIIGPFSFQPAELLKLGVLIYLGAFLGSSVQRGEKITNRKSLIHLGIILGLAMLFVVVFQRDLGTGAALGAIAFLQLFLAGIDKKFLIAILAGTLVAGAIFIAMEPHRIDRVRTFIQQNPASIQDDGSYHIMHARVAIGSGGLFGVGIGNSIQAAGYLPEPTSDSIFAIMGETFGFVGLMLVLVFFTVLLYRLLRLAQHLHDPTSRLIVIGIFGWIAAHVFINIMAMIDLIPLTGITLPFLSTGGTSMMFIAFALGLAFQLSTESSHTPADVSTTVRAQPKTVSRRRNPVPLGYNRRSRS